ncbi:hypothetical protein [Neoroseomonas rubea]|uniref:hypothetical protein n=1 Tax=Neoroseomonas rubea TaxID=2748666 RepID=UPI0018DF7A83|nr:hypothetical protein [Roseomonas rubea]
MSDVRGWDHRAVAISAAYDSASEGRWTMALGIVAMLLGLAAAAGGALIGFGQTSRLIPLPGGLPAAEPETVAIAMFACGAITMLLGVVSIYKAQDR